jgi:hypothetical protein
MVDSNAYLRQIRYQLVCQQKGLDMMLIWSNSVRL